MKYSEMGQPQKRGGRIVRRLFFLIFAVVFWAGCGYKLIQLQADSRDYDRQIAELQAHIEQEKEKQLEYKAQQKYFLTDEYKEQEARNRFGLIYPGESLIVIE